MAESRFRREAKIKTYIAKQLVKAHKGSETLPAEHPLQNSYLIEMKSGYTFWMQGEAFHELFREISPAQLEWLKRKTNDV